MVDGYTWESWDNSTKVGWVFGFWDGIYQAHREGVFFLVRIPGLMERKVAGTYKRADEVTEGLDNEFRDRISLSGITSGQQVAGLDAFYKDYRNKRILAGEAIYIVKLEVTGGPQEFIEQVTRIIRMPWDDRRKEQKSLLEKNQEYKEAFEKWGKYLPISVIPTP